MPISFALFQITQYEQVGYPPTLRFIYQSGTMGLRDASLFAGALSYVKGAYVSVIAADPIEEPYYEWWYAGVLWGVGSGSRRTANGGGLTDLPERMMTDRIQELVQGGSPNAT
jgi:hypothetical protein